MFTLLVVALVLSILVLLGILVSHLSALALAGDVALIVLIGYLVVRVRAKMSRRERETMRARIDELERKIELIAGK
jgi:hypothetical protein